MIPFHIRLEPLKLTYYSLITIFPKYYFKTGTLFLPLFILHVFTALEFNSNYFQNYFETSLKISKAT